MNVGGELSYRCINACRIWRVQEYKTVHIFNQRELIVDESNRIFIFLF